MDRKTKQNTDRSLVRQAKKIYQVGNRKVVTLNDLFFVAGTYTDWIYSTLRNKEEALKICLTNSMKPDMP